MSTGVRPHFYQWQVLHKWERFSDANLKLETFAESSTGYSSRQSSGPDDDWSIQWKRHQGRGAGEKGRRGREKRKGREEGRREREGRKGGGKGRGRREEGREGRKGGGKGIDLSLSHDVNVYLSRQRGRDLNQKNAFCTLSQTTNSELSMLQMFRSPAPSFGQGSRLKYMLTFAHTSANESFHETVLSKHNYVILITFKP